MPEQITTSTEFIVGLRANAAIDDLAGEIVELPVGPALREVHVGHYRGLSEAYARARGGARGPRPAANLSWERYLVSPADPDPASWRTEVIVPLKDVTP